MSAHCDSRVVHGPGECEYCDHYPDLQAQRILDGVAFTGHLPKPGQRPCPADEARPPGSPSDHARWGGNRPKRPTARRPELHIVQAKEIREELEEIVADLGKAA